MLINNRANRICKSVKIRVGSSYRKLSRRDNVFHETERRVLQKGCLKYHKKPKCSQELQFVAIVLAEIMFPPLGFWVTRQMMCQLGFLWFHRFCCRDSRSISS